MYYQGSSEIQADALHTLHLMNPNYVGYPADTQQITPQLLFSSASANALNSAVIPHAPLPQAHQFVEDIHNTVPRFNYNIRSLVDHNQTTNMPPRGLSLRLSAHQTDFDNSNQDFMGHSSDWITSKPSPSPASTDDQSINGLNIISTQRVVISSKYLKAAQELLDEVATVVGKDTNTNKATIVRHSINGTNALNKEGESKDGGGELTTAQIQEIQLKKAKLTSMLNEVEQRYRHYHHQMQIVVASFEQAAGIGSARTYTELAFKTISKQFRCLKAAISAQIKALNKSLGEEDSLDNKLEGSRLKFIGHQLRQQRALQQLGTNAWRPQRGLPERAVSVLRAWLFEHFLHPYPKDSDKQMLAKETGLTKSQVSNWFINARVRLWKPMVEEMYKEETKNEEHSKTGGMDQLNVLQLQSNHPSHTVASLQARPNAPKKPRNWMADSPSSIISTEIEMKNRETSTNYIAMSAANINRYEVNEVGRFRGDEQLATGGFQGNNYVSLTLALPPTDQQINFRDFDQLGTRIEPGAAAALNPFPPQLLPDFVA